MVREFLLYPLRFYQRYLTLLGFGSCRYYPTCSEYARWQIETNPSLAAALFSSLIRILRCNQLFDGGIDYPVVSCGRLRQEAVCGSVRKVKYWFVPRQDRCLVVKNIFSSKGRS